MNPLERMRERVYELAQDAPDKMSYEQIMKICATVIVQEKVLDDDAFQQASKAFAEGFNGLKLGAMSNGKNTDKVEPLGSV
jgi:predicted alpha/beta hydrolase